METRIREQDALIYQEDLCIEELAQELANMESQLCDLEKAKSSLASARHPVADKIDLKMDTEAVEPPHGESSGRFGG